MPVAMRRRRALPLLVAIAAVTVPSVAAVVENPSAAFASAAAAFQEGDVAAAIRHLMDAARAGHGEAQAQLGAAYVHGHGGLDADAVEAKRWFRLAAAQGHGDATHNLVVLCDAKPSCIGAGDDQQAIAWLREAARQGIAAAAYEAGHLLLAQSADDDALDLFLHGARRGHAGSMYNAAHMCSSRPDRLTEAVVWFGRAATQGKEAKVAADATVAVARVRRLWVQRAEATDANGTTALFRAASLEEAPPSAMDAPDGVGAAEADARATDVALEAWTGAMVHWAAFEGGFSAHASYDNAPALASLRRAMNMFAALIEDDDVNHANGEGALLAAGPRRRLGELRRYLLLSKLAEGAKALGRSDEELHAGVKWLEAMALEPLCSELYAQVETQPSCFNDQLASAITMWRRTGSARGHARVDELVRIGNAHPHAATRWASPLQTPRVYLPGLEAAGWWDARRFEVCATLEAAWASGRLTEDMARIDAAVASSAAAAAAAAATAATASNADGGDDAMGFARIVSSGAPIRGPPGLDGDREGVWSEWMLFDGARWDERRCAQASALCSILRASAAVSGRVLAPDGVETPPQGQVTIFRLRPSAHVLPHVGVTNRRLVLQFPLRGWQGVRFRVGGEWREYEEGRALVFDDSFEHEVVHEGSADRYVLYAVLHHPGLGEPELYPEPAGDARGDAADGGAGVELEDECALEGAE